MTYLQKKKLAFMSIVNSVKGFVRTVSGIPPLTLPDCVDDNSLINYTIDGNSIQDGTPTPEAPVEVESVGEKTINLFPSGEEKTIISNGIEFISDGKGTYTIHGTSTSQAIATFNLNEEFTFPISVNNGGTGVMHFNNDAASAYAIMHFLKDGTSVDNWTLSPSMRISSGYNALGGKTCNQVRLLVTAGQTINMTISFMVINNIVEPTTFEPFGYKIPVKCSGINLFNPEEVIAKFDSGDTYNSGSYNCTSIQLKPNTKYYMKTFNPTGETGYFYMGKYKSPNQSPSSTICINVDINQYKRGYEEAVTTDETGCLYLGSVFISANERRRILRENQIQIVEGSYTKETAPDYEPYVEPTITSIYLDEPLRKIGDSSDYIDFENQKVIRSVASDYITFANNKSDYSKAYSVFLTPISKKPFMVENTYGYIMSNKFLENRNGLVYIGNYPSAIQPYITSGKINAIAFTLSTTDITTIEQANEAIGNGFDIYYALAEETETAISLPKLPTIKGTTIYSIDTAIQPSNMSATYYSTAKE